MDIMLLRLKFGTAQMRKNTVSQQGWMALTNKLKLGNNAGIVKVLALKYNFLMFLINCKCEVLLITWC